MSIATDKNLAAFLDDAAYTVRVVFLDASPATPSAAQKEYTYVTNIPGIKTGDILVVEGVGQKVYLAESMQRVQAVINRASGADPIDELLDTPVAGRTVGCPKSVFVVEVHDSVQIAPGDPCNFKWVIGKLDLSYYQQLLTRNDTLTRTVGDAYKQAARQGVRQQLLGMLAPEEAAKLSSLLGTQVLTAQPVTPATPTKQGD